MPQPHSRRSDAVVLIPTYNEIEALPIIVQKVFAANPDVDVMVIDDASPDGTGALADGLAAADPRISVLHRRGKEGLGKAYVAGFGIALERGYDFAVEMDADGSHPPETLPEMLAAARAEDGPGLVIGSRWVPGGRTVDWPRRREWLSRAANAYAGFILATRVKDITAGYRVYAAPVLRSIALETIGSRGYYFQVDMTVRTLDAGFRIAEVPIVFREREVGVSKMSLGIIVEAMLKVTGLGVRRFLGRLFGRRR